MKINVYGWPFKKCRILFGLGVSVDKGGIIKAGLGLWIIEIILGEQK